MDDDDSKSVWGEFGEAVEHGSEPITILIVDDKAMVRDITTKFVQLNKNMPPARFIEAVDGEDGLQQYKKHCPDIIITDREMPNKDGYEMVRDIRAIEHEHPDGVIPIIVMQSGLGEMNEAEYVKLAYEAGVNDGHAYTKHDSSMYKAVVNMAADIAAGKSGQSASPSSEQNVLEPKT